MPRKFDFISPGIQLTEVDQSTVPAQLQEDGPLLIGRALRGPSMKPIRIQSFDDFVTVFGNPVYGPQPGPMDIWRQGNTVAPTYAGIAAEAWLAANDTPITFVRLLGEQSSNATTAGYAGWDTATDLDTAYSASGGAFGLFVAPSSSNPQVNSTGSLAAIFYVNEGSIELSGTIADNSGSIGTGSATMIESLGSGEPATFRAIVKNDSGTIVDNVVFDFTPGSKNYIRTVFNTTPHKVNSSINDSADLKTYWLGETFEEMLNRDGSSGTGPSAGAQLGIVLGLASGSAGGPGGTSGVVPGAGRADLTEYSDHEFAATAAKSGWIINRDPSEDNINYTPENAEKLFRIIALHEGKAFQDQYYCAIEGLRLGTEVNKNSTFTLSVYEWGTKRLVEQFSNLSMNPVSDNYILKRIGDMNMVWDDGDKKFNMVGKYNNQSDYIRIEMADALKNDQQPQDEYALPFGFYGPQKFKNFCLSGSNSRPVSPDDYSSNLLTAMVVASGNLPGVNERISLADQSGFALIGSAEGDDERIITFKFPSLRLTTVNSKGVQNANYKVTDFFGVNQQLSSSNLLDQSYRDLFRAMPRGFDAHENTGTAADATETSFIFSLDDVVYDSTNVRAYYVSGSRLAGTSYTATNDDQALLDAKIKQFIVPLFGGFDGLNITELEPFNNRSGVIGSSESTSYTYYSLNKALDIAEDPETVEMDLLLLPGINNSDITNRMIEVVDERQDSLAIIDLEDAYTTSAETTPSLEGKGSLATVVSKIRSRNFDSSYAAAYHPWVRVQQKGDTVVTPVPPSVAACGALARSQALTAPWFAPAGFNRGGLTNLGGTNGPSTLSVVETMNKANRDDLYELDVNPIARLQGEFVIFGQKTLQQTPSALDRINVRRMMIYLKKRIGRIANTILFDQNIQVTWNKFKSKSERVLNRIKARGGITEFKVVLDSTTTTPDLQDRNILYAKIYVKPAKAIEFIAVDFVITRSGVQF
jgi:phage tail sheath protein FI